MPFFQITGVSAKGRKVSRRSNAETERGARSKATGDGVTVESAIRLPLEPASDVQLSYARSLGVRIPSSPNVEQMTDLISRAVEPAASSWLASRAEELGADFDRSRYLGQGYVSRQINEVLPRESHAALVELAFWYLQSVLKHQRRADWSSPNESGVEIRRVFSVAEKFISDEKVKKSLTREYNDPLYDFLEFGDGWGGKRSTRTTAYASAVELLSREGLC
jgi:hypothetical protein